MRSLQTYMDAYKKQMQKGDVPTAYRGLMDFIMGFRMHLKNKYSQYAVSGLYHGYMDMTYFSATPPALKNKQLKIAVVFLHETVRFEVWLAANNKQVQRQYRRILEDRVQTGFAVTPQGKGVDSIAAATLRDNPDFNDLTALRDALESGIACFIENIGIALADSP